ncbi:MAG: BtpA family membrane complex biogenesis protein [Planctomycetes bacterium]|nr:BtpA family membrane complex biogenesis protein [Planctomycetota bacterium]
MELQGSKALVGMIHLGALPGTPHADRPLADVVRQAVDEALLLASSGVDALLLENMHDAPYLKREVGPEITAAVTACACAVHDAVSVPFGIQILAGANRAALAAALASGACFVRAEGYVFSSVADEGLLADADAGPLLRYRRQIGADRIKVLCDVKKKHSAHAITADIDLAATARAGAFFGADGIIVTGAETGSPADVDDVATVAGATDLPVIVGSGITPDNVGDFLAHADAVIVGSWLKEDGAWDNPPDPRRVEEMVAAVQATRRG